MIGHGAPAVRRARGQIERETEVQISAAAAREGRRLVAMLTAGLVRCPLCGRAAGLDRGAEPCQRCRVELAPNRVQLAIWALGFSNDEIADLARVSRRTLMSVRRGIPIGKRSAMRIAKTLGILLTDIALTERARGGLGA